jgi:hypothetical protein
MLLERQSRSEQILPVQHKMLADVLHRGFYRDSHLQWWRSRPCDATRELALLAENQAAASAPALGKADLQARSEADQIRDHRTIEGAQSLSFSFITLHSTRRRSASAQLCTWH